MAFTKFGFTKTFCKYSRKLVGQNTQKAFFQVQMMKVVWNFKKRLNGSVLPAVGISHFSLRKYHQLKSCNKDTAKYITWEYFQHPKNKIKIFVFFPPRRAILNMLPVLCSKQCSILSSTNSHSARANLVI